MSKTARERLISVCRSAFDRNLTNVSGGNFSIRLPDGTFLATQTHNTRDTLMVMVPEDLLRVDLKGNALEGTGKVTSSWITHSAVYENFPKIHAVIHAHPRYATVFAAAGRCIEPYLDGMQKYGTIPSLSGTYKVDSAEFAGEVVNTLRLQQAVLERYGHGVLYPRHGLLVAAPALEEAYDLLDRIESNAVAVLFSKLL